MMPIWEKLLLWFFPRLMNPPKVKTIPIVSYIYMICLVLSMLFGDWIYSILNVSSLPGWHPFNIITDFFGGVGYIRITSIYLLFLMGTRVEDAIGRRSYITTILLSFTFYKLIAIFILDPNMLYMGGVEIITLTIMSFFIYLFPHCYIYCVVWYFGFRGRKYPVWLFGFVLILALTIMLLVTGFNMKNIPTTASIAIFLPMLVVTFIGGRKEILRKATILNDLMHKSVF